MTVDLTKAVHRWQEDQLRILVLGSLVIQLFLIASTSLRKVAICSSFRVFIWLAYLGSDALAVYALATLFNSHKQADQAGGSNSLLVLLWAPILLMHIGGHRYITAYNIEDNELWMRHVVTSWSQITVAIYVFWKSWRAGGDRLLLWAAILLFLQGANECLNKAYRLRFGTVDGLVMSLDRTKWTPSISCSGDGADDGPLDEFVQAVKKHISSAKKGDEPPEDDAKNVMQKLPHIKQTLDLLSPYGPDRLLLLKYFWGLLDDNDKVCGELRRGLSDTFDSIYTGRKISLLAQEIRGVLEKERRQNVVLRMLVRKEWLQAMEWLQAIVATIVPLIALGLFHRSHKEDYNRGDVKVTYALFGCTAVCHLFSSLTRLGHLLIWPEVVAQYSLVGFFMKKHDWAEPLRGLVRLAGSDLLRDWKYMESLLMRLYSLDPCKCSSSRSIIRLVRTHLETGWEKHIHSTADYFEFNDQRGRMALRLNGCDHGLLHRSLMVPFDESVLLWHMATDMCFFYHHHKGGASPGPGGHQCAMRDDAAADACAAWCPGSPHHWKAARCREISNYMVHLLCENPNMFMVGSRQHLFMAAFKELKKKIFKDDKPPMEVRALTQRIIAKAQQPRPADEGSNKASFIRDAWSLAKALQDLGDDERMWEVIQGVWVEMLCFSAGRCRGYLHAKSLGTGGEFLNYVWLLMSYMGMETLSERLQRTGHPNVGGNTTAAAPQNIELHTGAPATTDIIIIQDLV